MTEHAAIQRDWKSLLRDSAGSGVPPETFFAVVETDGDCGLARDLAGDRHVLERSARQGVVVAVAGTRFFTAALIWRGRVHGFFRHDLAARGVENIVRDLQEFRLGWLPDETVRESGGLGSAFADLPPEAEGFPVTFITGANRDRFAGYGKLCDAASGAAG